VSILFAALGAVLGAVASVVAPRIWASVRARPRPAWFGVARITYVRTAFATVFGLAGAAGISLSISDHSHKHQTYELWYGLAGLALFGVVVTTIIIERRSAAAAAPQTQSATSDVELDPVWEIAAEVMHRGSELLTRLPADENWPADARAWMAFAGNVIGDITDGTEAALLSAAGAHDPRLERQVADKVEYIRDKLQPKARAHYWTPSAAKLERSRTERHQAPLAGAGSNIQQTTVRDVQASGDVTVSPSQVLSDTTGEHER
jgi:hypothetical protein